MSAAISFHCLTTPRPCAKSVSASAARWMSCANGLGDTALQRPSASGDLYADDSDGATR
jgi:hypothetical protein